MVERVHHTTFAPRRAGETVELCHSYSAGAGRDGILVCPPSPLLGGDLDNNVVRALAGAAAAAGWPVARFNYRGVGASLPAGPLPRYEYWRAVLGRGDLGPAIADGREALARSRRLFRPVAIWGYSLGAAVALALACADAPEAALALVGPPLGAHDMGALRTRSHPALVVFAAADELEPVPADLARFAPHTVRVLAGADHFFRGREAELAALVLSEMPQ